jgi:flagellar protein FliS
VDHREVEKAHINITKTINIIQEFQATLNYKYPVAKDFNNVYVYVKDRLVEANVKKDKEILEEVLGHLRTMRDTWKEVMRITKNGTDTKARGPAVPS